jgi:hypothetical protein
LLGIKVSESQAYRRCKAISEQVEEDQLYIPTPGLSELQSKAEEIIYGMVDGSMLLTRNGWQENKVGRIFKASPCQESKTIPLLSQTIDKQMTDKQMTDKQTTDKQAVDNLNSKLELTRKWQIEADTYLVHRGEYPHFTAKFEKLLPPDSLCQKVFVTDGAVWIGNWLKQAYPKATHILDFFHVCEKLACSSLYHPESEKWFTQQKERLLEGNQELVYEVIRSLKRFKEKEKLLHYLTSNAYRMNYKAYIDRGLMISSGPLEHLLHESAHRTLLQARMKKSGQHWSESGCDRMAKLRVVYCSNRFELITNILKKQAA